MQTEALKDVTHKKSGFYFEGLGLMYIKLKGNEVQWPSCKTQGCRFETHQRRCFMSLSKTHLSLLILVQSRKTHPDITEKMLNGMLRIKSTNKQN